VRQGDGCGRGAGTHHLVERVDGERLDPDPYLAGCGLAGWLLDDVHDFRPAELVEHDDSWHGGFGIYLAGLRERQWRKYSFVAKLDATFGT
jgi:hypothetical protein